MTASAYAIDAPPDGIVDAPPFGIVDAVVTRVGAPTVAPSDSNALPGVADTDVALAAAQGETTTP